MRSQTILPAFLTNRTRYVASEPRTTKTRSEATTIYTAPLRVVLKANSLFINNYRVMSDKGGGVIAYNFESLQAESNLFLGNSGAAIGTNGMYRINVTDSVFEDNTANACGGSDLYVAASEASEPTSP